MPAQERAKDKVWYFYVGPDGEIYENQENLPVSVISKFSRFKDKRGSIFRFAYDPRANRFFIQDSGYRKLLGAGDENIWHLLNEAIKFVGEEFETTYMDRSYGDPPRTSIHRKLSQYHIAWNYIAKYMREEFGFDPLDVDVCDYVPGPDQVNETFSFSPTGVQCGTTTTEGPTISINRNIHKSNKYKQAGENDPNYGLLNQVLVAAYLKNFEAINSKRPTPEEQAKFATKWSQFSDDFGYDLYFAILDNEGKTHVFKAHQKDRNRIQNDNQIRSMLNERLGGDYRGPVVLFSYLPDNDMLVFQNYSPQDMQQFDNYRKMLDTIKQAISATTNTPEDKLVLTYDASKMSPFITKMSRYRVLWDYITDVMRDQFHTDPSDIPVVEMPVPQQGALAAFVMSPQDEKEKSPESMKYRVSHGIAVNYPFIIVDSRIGNMGTKYHAIIHEYAHYAQRVLNIPFVPYSYKGGISDAADADEKQRRFVEYIRNPDEQQAHFQQMLYMLKMGMDKDSIIDFFSPREDLLHRAEYRKILQRAWDAFHEAKERSAAPKGQKTAATHPMPGVNDWWYIGSQETLNRSRHKNDEPTTKPFNLRNKRSPSGKRPYEEMLRTHHDPEQGFQKTIEQLLEESRI